MNVLINQWINPGVCELREFASSLFGVVLENCKLFFTSSSLKVATEPTAAIHFGTQLDKYVL